MAVYGIDAAPSAKAPLSFDWRVVHDLNRAMNCKPFHITPPVRYPRAVQPRKQTTGRCGVSK
eukprot:3878378-Amphidinium_carterae.1